LKILDAQGDLHQILASSWSVCKGLRKKEGEKTRLGLYNRISNSKLNLFAKVLKTYRK
jgi:hypothetical protein